jgi:predicted aspartyl protease
MNPSARIVHPPPSMCLKRVVGGALPHIVRFITLLLLSVAASSAGDEVLYSQKLEPRAFPILVPATIGGKTYTFELDTGATLHFVDPALKPFLGAYRENKQVDSLGHAIDVEIFDAPAITIGGWILPPSKVGVSDMNRFRSLLGVDIRGYIGANALKGCSLFLDFDHERMRILKGGKAPIGMESLGLASKDDSPPFIRCDLQGKTMEFLLDTGATGYLGLQHEAFVAMVQNGAIDMNGARKTAAETGAGRMVHLTGRFTRGQLLGVNLLNTPVFDANVTNTIGLGFLLNFNAVIDFKNLKFFYQRRKTIPPIYKGTLLGVGIAFPGGRNYIYGLAPLGPMAIAGLKIGDRIVRFGPLKEADINAMSIYRVCLDHPGGTVEVQVQHSGEGKASVLKVKLPEEELVSPPKQSR